MLKPIPPLPPSQKSILVPPASPQSTFIWTRLSGVYAQHGETDRLTFDQIETELQNWSRQSIPSVGKMGLAAYTPARFRESRRLLANALNASCVVLDLDKIPIDTLGAVLTRLADYDYLVHTTFSHLTQLREKELTCSRVIIPLSRDVSALEWPIVWRGVHAIAGITGDEKCKDMGHIYFVPCRDQDGDPPWMHRNRGRTLSVEDALSKAPDPSDENAPPPAPLEIGGNRKLSEQVIKKLAKKWQSAKNSMARIALGESLEALITGLEFAAPGARDTTAFQLCRDIAREFPDLDPEHFTELVTKSLSRTEEPGVEGFRDKLWRALEAAAQEKRDSEANAAQEHIRQVSQAFGTDRKHPYTDDELRTFAELHGCSVSEIPWVIQRGSQYYMYVAGAHRGPYNREEMQNAAYRDLAPAITADVDTDGKSPQQIVREYGAVAVNEISDISAQISRYDFSTQTLITAPCKIRPLAPEFNPSIQRWLDVMAGEEDAEALTLWIRAVTKLDRPCAALLLTGPKHAGKSLLANGLARIWGHHPTEIQDAIGANFNDALLQNPLVFADEYMPKMGNSGALRQFVQSRGSALRRKFQKPGTILGSRRLILAANNEDMLAMNEHLTSNDIAAIAERFYHIPVSIKAADVLKATDTSGWVERDQIARHALFLAQEMPLPDGLPRFIMPEKEQIFTEIATRSGAQSVVLQWLCAYLLNPGLAERKQAKIRVTKVGLAVCPTAIVDCWGDYVRNEYPPRTKVIIDALINMSRTKIRPRFNGERHTCHVIKKEFLIAWAQRTGMAEPEAIRRLLGAPIDEDYED